MAETFTIADLAKTTGVTKQTVTRRARELGIFDTMQVVDARGTRAMTAEQASMLADAVTKAAPEGLSALHEEADKQAAEQLSNAILEALQNTINAQKAIIETQQQTITNLTATLDQTRLDHAVEVSRLQEEIRHTRLDLRQTQACVQELAAAHWWEKRAIVARYALPPAPSGSQVE